MSYNNYKGKSIKEVPLKTKTIKVRTDQSKSKIFCESKSMIKAEEVSIVTKNDHENIKKVFTLKDLNIRFTKTFESMSTKYRAGFIKTKNWLFKDKDSLRYFKITVIALLILVNIFFLVNEILKNKEGFTKTAEEFKKEMPKEITTNKIVNDSKNKVKTYKVKKGDTLWNIAKNNDTTVDKILKINPDLTEKIKEGQRIKLKD